MAGIPVVNHGDHAGKPITSVKLLCSYGGKILPRYPDGKLRYVGGETRVLSVDRCVSFAELAVRLAELCGEAGSVSVRCQLPTEDLDALVSIVSDDDVENLIEEYNRFNRGKPSPLKIRVFLSRRKSDIKKLPSPPPSLSSGKLLESGKPIKSTGNFVGSRPCVREILAGRMDGCHHHPLFMPIDSALKAIDPTPLRYYFARENPSRSSPMVLHRHWQ